VNDNGGTKVAADFAIAVTGTVPAPASFPGSTAGTPVAIGPGSYSVSETVDPGYAASYSAGCTGTIALGETKNCEITNNDKAATLVVTKTVVNDNGGTKVAADFAIAVTGAGPVPASFPGSASRRALAIGPVADSVTDTVEPGDAVSYSAGCTGTIALGETKTWEITNNDKNATMILTKTENNDEAGSKVAAHFAIAVTGTSPAPASFPGSANGTSVAIGPGSYSVTETVDPGYAVSYSTAA
jgi:hypothetical protein